MKRKLKMKLEVLVGSEVRKEGDEVDVEEPRASELVRSGAAEYADNPAEENIVPVRRAAVETTEGRPRAEHAVSREAESKKK